MSKRFTDTNKYKKSFHRSLPGPYKLFWDYLYHDCDHAGIWHVDMEVAQIYLGQDMIVEYEKAISLFNAGEERIVVLNGGSKWFIKPFIKFQYGDLNPANRLHASVLQVLQGEKIKGLTSPLEQAKDKDKDKDKNKDKDKAFEQFWKTYPRHEAKKDALKAWAKIDPALYEKIYSAIERQKETDQWKKDKGKFIPLPATWLNACRWEDEIAPSAKRWDA